MSEKNEHMLDEQTQNGNDVEVDTSAATEHQDTPDGGDETGNISEITDAQTEEEYTDPTDIPDDGEDVHDDLTPDNEDEEDDAETSLLSGIDETENAKTADTAAAPSGRSSRVGRFMAKGQSRADAMESARKQSEEREKTRIERQERQVAWASLKTAMRSKRPVTGEISASQVKVTKRTDIKTGRTVEKKLTCARVDVKHGGHTFEVIVPFTMLFINSPIQNPTSEQSRLRRERNLLIRMLSSNVTILITGMDNRNGEAIIGNRRDYLLREQEYHFGGKHPRISVERDADNKIIGNPPEVDANIISVGEHALFVEIHGYEMSVPIHRLTYRYVESLRDAKDADGNLLFETGNKVKLSIVKIQMSEDLKLVSSMRVSGKLPERKVFQKNVARVNVDDSIVVTVTNIVPNKRGDSAQINCFCEKTEFPLIVTNVQTAMLSTAISAGSKIVVQVRGVDVKNSMVFGVLLRAL